MTQAQGQKQLITLISLPEKIPWGVSISNSTLVNVAPKCPPHYCIFFVINSWTLLFMANDIWNFICLPFESKTDPQGLELIVDFINQSLVNHWYIKTIGFVSVFYYSFIVPAVEYWYNSYFINFHSNKAILPFPFQQLRPLAVRL